MKIMGVGIGSTNAIKVQRAWMGTNLVGHSTGALVTKIRGNYNIVDNYLNFIEAPNGKNPIGTELIHHLKETDWYNNVSKFQWKSLYKIRCSWRF